MLKELKAFGSPYRMETNCRKHYINTVQLLVEIPNPNHLS